MFFVSSIINIKLMLHSAEKETKLQSTPLFQSHKHIFPKTSPWLSVWDKTAYVHGGLAATTVEWPRSKLKRERRLCSKHKHTHANIPWVCHDDVNGFKSASGSRFRASQPRLQRVSAETLELSNNPALSARVDLPLEMASGVCVPGQQGLSFAQTGEWTRHSGSTGKLKKWTHVLGQARQMARLSCLQRV